MWPRERVPTRPADPASGGIGRGVGACTALQGARWAGRDPRGPGGPAGCGGGRGRAPRASRRPTSAPGGATPALRLAACRKPKGVWHFAAASGSPGFCSRQAIETLD